jgi:hypothetical protein
MPAARETKPPKQWRNPRRVRAIKFALATCVVLSLIAWLAGGLSYVGQWSVMTASPARPYPVASGGTDPSGNSFKETRESRHYMLGDGLVMIYSMNEYTAGSYAHPQMEITSKSLAWATAPQYISPGTYGRFDYGPAGPIIGIRGWMLGPIVSLSIIPFVWLLRREVEAGHCGQCRYDLRAIPVTAGSKVTCPECGRVDG